MRAVYIADDGTEFEDEEECRAYEHLAEYQGKDSIIAGLDGKGNIMSFSKDEDFCNSVMVVGLDNGEAVDLFCDRCHREGYTNKGIHGPGIYLWAGLIGDYDGEWLFADKLIEEHQKIIEEVKGYKEKIYFE